MGYHTEFQGSFQLDKPLKAEHLVYLKAFSDTRHMKRLIAKLEKIRDPIREAVGLPLGFRLTGSVHWEGQDQNDYGIIYVKNNVVEVFGPIVITNASGEIRQLRAFLCHASDDKSEIEKLYNKLCEDRINPWLDKKALIPGQDWKLEITRAVRNSDVVIVCLSHRSINKIGFVQREVKFALDFAEEQPEGSIFIIPAKLFRQS